MRISDWSSDVCSSDLGGNNAASIILGPENGGIESSTTFVPGATDNWQKFDNTSYAAFAEGTYEVLDGLSLTLGGRYTWDKREATILNHVIDTRCGFTVDDDDNTSTPEVNPGDGQGRSEERRGGKECGSTCRSRWPPEQ